MSTYKFRYQFQVYPREVDYTKSLTFSALGSTILDAAGLSARECGFGMEQMHQEGFAWVLSRLAVEMDQYPKEYSSFSIETWIESITALVSTRHFIIRNEQDEVIGRATSLWSLIDKEKRRPVNLTDRKDLLAFVDGSPLDIETPMRIPNISSDSHVLHRVVYSDIDINGHVNSFKYVQWIFDLFALEQFKDHSIERFDVNYSQEALYGTEVFYKTEVHQGRMLYELTSEEGKAYCRMALQWHSKV